MIYKGMIRACPHIRAMRIDEPGGKRKIYPLGGCGGERTAKQRF